MGLSLHTPDAIYDLFLFLVGSGSCRTRTGEEAILLVLNSMHTGRLLDGSDRSYAPVPNLLRTPVYACGPAHRSAL